MPPHTNQTYWITFRIERGNFGYDVLVYSVSLDNTAATGANMSLRNRVGPIDGYWMFLLQLTEPKGDC